jgi:hypothetical protein
MFRDFALAFILALRESKRPEILTGINCLKCRRRALASGEGVSRKGSSIEKLLHLSKGSSEVILTNFRFIIFRLLPILSKGWVFNTYSYDSAIRPSFQSL